MAENLMFTIDWLSFTYKPKKKHAEDLSLLENFFYDFPEFDYWFPDMHRLERGRHGYSNVYQLYDEFCIMFHPDNEDMGIHVEFSSRSLPNLTKIFGLDDIQIYSDAKQIFQILKDRSCKIARLDIAYDDFTKTFTPLDFNRWKINGQISTNAQCWEYIGNEQHKGGTFYLGKRGRDRMLRIYDKEYESHGQICSVRYEFELRGKWSAWVQDQILNNGVFTVADLLDHFFVIKEAYNTNVKDNTRSVYKCEADIEESWALFLDSIRELCAKGIKAEVVVLNIKPEQSFSRMEKWLNTQVFKSLLMFTEVIGLDRLPGLLESYKDKLKPADYQMLKKYKYEYDSRVI